MFQGNRSASEGADLAAFYRVPGQSVGMSSSIVHEERVYKPDVKTIEPRIGLKMIESQEWGEEKIQGGGQKDLLCWDVFGLLVVHL